MNLLLHERNLGRVPLVGRELERMLRNRAAYIASATAGMPDPDISIVIRSRNDHAYVKEWFEDIHAQIYSGRVEIIVVDTESTDGTAEYAASHGAKVITIKQKDFSYPEALNSGFRAATHPYVVTLVGHSNWTNKLALKSITLWSTHEDVGGIYSWPLANKNSSVWDRIECMAWPLVHYRAAIILRRALGPTMGANCSVVKREAWEKLGGYDQLYAHGGEDAAFGRSLLSAGYVIVREPAIAMFHSHGLGFIDSVKQLGYYLQIGLTKPRAFNEDKLFAHRPDLRT